MPGSGSRRRRFEERRHLVGSIILMGLLFFGNLVPVWTTLLIMLVVSWVAVIDFSGFRASILLSMVIFLMQFLTYFLHHWRTSFGEWIGFGDAVEMSLEMSVLGSLVCGALIWVKNILRSRKAGFDEVLGAFNLYIWIAIIFACLYTLLSKFNTGAFQLQARLVKGMDMAEWNHNFNELYYFSFVTQTTLGYGDIVPVSHTARSLAITQAMIGQFYVAVILAYILNLWISAPGRFPESRDDGHHHQ